MSTCITFLESYGSVFTTLLLAGLFGGFTHCTGMCGPFVVGQQAARLEATSAKHMREWHRLAGWALVPYHAGRMTTYVLLGVLAALLSSRFHEWAGFRYLSAGLLVLAALVFLSAALGYKPRTKRRGLGIARALSVVTRQLFEKPTGIRGYLLGIFLGFLPCGLVYGALSVAASQGDVGAAAAGMAIFTVGTIPALVMVGIGSRWMLQKWRPQMRLAARLIMGLNALILLAIAGNRIG